MNKLEKAFDGHKAFIGFLTAGDPSLEDTERYIEIMAKFGCDLIEIGIPFSDPVAEGEVIQKATIRALAAGTTTDKIFDMVERVALKIDIPLVFMTYLNPVYVYGAEKFSARCEKAGISGIIVPDMPYEEKGELAEPARAHGVKIISLIAPTSEGRVGMIARDAEGFIYLVSSMGVTGVRSEITTNVKAITDTIRKYTDVPVAVGFGIATPDQAEDMAGASDGAIVGSAIVKIIEEHGSKADEPLAAYIRSMKDGVEKAEGK